MLSLVHSIQTHMAISNNIEHILKISLIKWEILIRQCIYIYIYIIGNTNHDCETNVKVKNYLNLLFIKTIIPVIIKPTSRNNATMIDHINTNNFLDNDLHSGIITADISDLFPTSLISEELMLDSSNKLIHITKQELMANLYVFLKLFSLLLRIFLYCL